MDPPKMLTICLEDAEEPLGFIEIDDTTTLAIARDTIVSELEDLPEHFRFAVPSPAGGMVKLSLMQETKRLAMSYLPKITIREVPPEASSKAAANAASVNTTNNPIERPVSPFVPLTFNSTAPAVSSAIPLPQTAEQNNPIYPPISNILRSPSPSPNVPTEQTGTKWQTAKSQGTETKKQGTTEELEGMQKLSLGRRGRPSLDTPLNDIGIDSLWEFYFEKRPVSKVRVDEIPFALYSIVQEKLDPSSDEFRALQALVINLGPLTYGLSDDRDEYENPKQVFYKILKTFGPLDGLLTRITSMLKMKEYHGNITSKAAEDSVRRQAVGTYLLRLSNSSPGSLALTVRTNETHVHNYLVERTPEFGFMLGKDTFNTIEEVILRNTKRLRFRIPCKDSPFRRTFDQINVTRAYTAFEEIPI